MKLSLKLKLVALGAAGMVSIAVLGLAADRLLTFAANSASDLQVIGRVQRSQMYADMMHDAIRGDFFHAMIVKDNAPTSARDEVRNGIKEHAAKLRSNMADARAGAKDSALVASLTVTTPHPGSLHRTGQRADRAGAHKALCGCRTRGIVQQGVRRSRGTDGRSGQGHHQGVRSDDHR